MFSPSFRDKQNAPPASLVHPRLPLTLFCPKKHTLRSQVNISLSQAALETGKPAGLSYRPQWKVPWPCRDNVMGTPIPPSAYHTRGPTEANGVEMTSSCSEAAYFLVCPQRAQAESKATAQTLAVQSSNHRLTSPSNAWDSLGGSPTPLQATSITRSTQLETCEWASRWVSGISSGVRNESSQGPRSFLFPPRLTHTTKKY